MSEHLTNERSASSPLITPISKCILLVDDNTNDLELTLLALKKLELPRAVKVAHDGAEALDFLYCRENFQTRSKGNPAIILLDLKMPKGDGLEVLRQVKGDERLRTIPVIMFISSRHESDVAHCYAHGANAYVVKPVDFQEFSTAINAIQLFWIGVNEPPAEAVQT